MLFLFTGGNSMYWLQVYKMAVCFFMACPVLSHALEPDKIFEKVSPSVWGVTSLDVARAPLGWGTAVVVGPGRLITNCHVLKRAKGIQITKENITYGALAGLADFERDLCEIKVANFNAPALEIGPTQNLKTGQKVYAIGNPKGLDLTMSEGIISSLRQVNESGLPLIQTTAPISHGSSGGGLFDSEGRLVGITFGMFKEGQNLNFAQPANWIAEIEPRYKANLAKEEAIRNNPAGPQAASTNYAGPRRINETWEYRLTDRYTRFNRTFSHRIDKIDGTQDRVTFNQGARIEDTNGKVIALNSFVAGEFDIAMPPGGWIDHPLTAGKKWRAVFSGLPHRPVQYRLNAYVVGEEKVVVPAGEFMATRIEWKGQGNSSISSIPYVATVWYASDIDRIVKFTAQYIHNVSNFSSAAEVIELVRHTKN